jgi:flagellar protein FliO/FliZ
LETPVTSVLWFLFILALIPGVLWLIKRLPAVKGTQSAASRVVGVLPLSGSQRILTVEVGQGDSRTWLVLGVTPSSITLLHHMAPQAEASALQEAPAPSFVEALKRAGLPKGAPK